MSWDTKLCSCPHADCVLILMDVCFYTGCHFVSLWSTLKLHIHQKGWKGIFSYEYLSVDLHMLLLLNVPRHAQTGNAMLLQFIHLKQYLIWYYDDILHKKCAFFSSIWYIWIIYERVSHCSLLPSLNGWFMRTIMHM